MKLNIRNQGEVDPASFWLQGASTARGDTAQIGQFGSGAKHALLILLRHNVPFRIFSGEREIVVGTVEVAAHGTTHKVMTVDGERTSMSLEFGALDWANPALALRELVSNALDQGEEYANIMVIGEPVTPQPGMTQIEIDVPIGGPMFLATAEMNKWFLHSEDKQSQILMPKSQPSPMRFYRKGVFIFESATPSHYDYNDLKGAVKINESRTMTEQGCHHAVEESIKQLSSEESLAWFKKLLAVSRNTYAVIPVEWDLNYYSLEYNIRESWIEHVKTNYTVFTEDTDSHNKAASAGEKPFYTTASFIRSFGINHLTSWEGKQKKAARKPKECEMPMELERLYWSVANVLFNDGHIHAAPPEPKAFTSTGGKALHGFVKDGEIWLNADQHSVATIIEELLHWSSGYSDFTREFQECLVKVAAHYLKFRL